MEVVYWVELKIMKYEILCLGKLELGDYQNKKVMFWNLLSVLHAPHSELIGSKFLCKGKIKDTLFV